jgi:hypothetical protein
MNNEHEIVDREVSSDKGCEGDGAHEQYRWESDDALEEGGGAGHLLGE